MSKAASAIFIAKENQENDQPTDRLGIFRFCVFRLIWKKFGMLTTIGQKDSIVRNEIFLLTTAT